MELGPTEIERQTSVSLHSVRQRDNKPRRLTPAQAIELEHVLEWINTRQESDYSSDDDETYDDSKSSVGKPHLIHATPYHKNSLTSLFISGSSTYAQLLIVVCIVLVMTEVLKRKNNVRYSEGFFAYLYLMSIIFFLYVFGYLLRRKNLKKRKMKNRLRRQESKKLIKEQNDKNSSAEKVVDDLNATANLAVGQAIDMPSNGTKQPSKSKKIKVSRSKHSHVSFFLRAGAVAFGLGTVIYDGLEFGAFLETPQDSPCFSILKGVNPILHATFAFFQMYFIFISARLSIHRFKVIARFGFMHCVSTNVCVWIRTLVRESLKEITEHFHHQHDDKSKDNHHSPHEAMGGGHHRNERAAEHGREQSLLNMLLVTVNETLDVSTENLDHLNNTNDEGLCGRRILLGNFIADASPFLYPFLIEYSLIGAAVLYVLWANIGVYLTGPNKVVKDPSNVQDDAGLSSNIGSHHELRVDCSNSHKGLFSGLFCLTVSLLSLVLFLVFTPQPEFRRLALFMADSTHSILLIVSLVVMAAGIYRARKLDFHPAAHTEELGNILLRVSAIGIFTYSVFTMMAGALSPSSAEEPPVLVLITGLLTAVEVAAQMLFISDMSRRRVGNSDDDRTKPGRQTVMFLLIINLALWLIYTFEVQKAEANPVQLNFYGFLPWAVVQRLTLPLCIFYRFHSVIVHAEIWKNTYRFEN